MTEKWSVGCLHKRGSLWFTQLLQHVPSCNSVETETFCSSKHLLGRFPGHMILSHSYLHLFWLVDREIGISSATLTRTCRFNPNWFWWLHFDSFFFQGYYDPTKSKIVHFSMNPLAKAKQQRAEELEKLRKENESLRRRLQLLEEGGCSPEDASLLSKLRPEAGPSVVKQVEGQSPLTFFEKKKKKSNSPPPGRHLWSKVSNSPPSYRQRLVAHLKYLQISLPWGHHVRSKSPPWRQTSCAR